MHFYEAQSEFEGIFSNNLLIDSPAVFHVVIRRTTTSFELTFVPHNFFLVARFQVLWVSGRYGHQSPPLFIYIALQRHKPGEKIIINKHAVWFEEKLKGRSIGSVRNGSVIFPYRFTEITFMLWITHTHMHVYKERKQLTVERKAKHYVRWCVYLYAFNRLWLIKWSRTMSKYKVMGSA